MGAWSRKWGGFISILASRAFFVLIIAQIPLFKIGTCETPIDIMACQLIASGSFPKLGLETLLYPGAIQRFFTQGSPIPTPDQLLNSYRSKMKDALDISDLKHLEVTIGSYLCVAGSLVGLVKRGRMGLFGLVLILWGILSQVFSQKHATYPNKTFIVYLEMYVAIILAFLSVKKDVRRLMKICEPGDISKRMKKFSKAKYF